VVGSGFPVPGSGLPGPGTRARPAAAIRAAAPIRFAAAAPRVVAFAAVFAPVTKAAPGAEDIPVSPAALITRSGLFGLSAYRCDCTGMRQPERPPRGSPAVGRPYRPTSELAAEHPRLRGRKLLVGQCTLVVHRSELAELVKHWACGSLAALLVGSLCVLLS
jgi:hypothetical protein